jgi:hypothetical protein
MNITMSASCSIEPVLARSRASAVVRPALDGAESCERRRPTFNVSRAALQAARDLEISWTGLGAAAAHQLR